MTSSQDAFPYLFDSNGCSSCRGRCCRGFGGYIWVSPKEIELMAHAKGMDIGSFSKQFVRQVKGRLSLQERLINGEHFCCFFDAVDCNCIIYSFRPNQCRSFPFWDQFKSDPKKLFQECPGVFMK